jgi:hypothetical protein
MTNEATTTTEAAAVAEQGAPTAPKQASSTKKASKKTGKPAAKKAAKGKENLVNKAAVAAGVIPPAKKDTPASKKASKPASKKASKAKPEASIPREFSKKEIVLDLLRRKGGATMAEIAKATDWQNHYADVRIMPTCVGNPACGAGIAAVKSA